VRTPLEGSGDFRSPECLALLEECDIVVTNPPFSLMKEYLTLLINSGKQFLILGNMNHAMYAEIFPYIFRRQVWLGHNSGHFWFRVPDYYEAKGTDFKEDDEGQKWRRMGNICWFTNMDIEKRHQSLVETLYKKYTVEEYPQYDNFEAIHVKKVQDIPVDYDGIISVPITFLDKHNPDEFEIVGELNHGCDSEFDLAKPILNGVAQYKRIAIRRKTAQEAGED